MLLLALMMTAADDANWAPPPTDAERQVADRLQATNDPAFLKAAARGALAALGDDNGSAGLLAELAETGSSQTAQQAAESLMFRPRVEAPLAAGYPPPTRVHAIEVKRLPAYRMAKADMKTDENTPFWALFGHIQRNQIAMTVPVQMDYDADGERMQSMAFLYRRPDMGQLGTDEAMPLAVEVVDVPSRLVLSTGLRSRDEAAIEAAESRLRSWLADHPEYEPSGPLMVLGYNAPMTPKRERIVEVQIPVTKADDR